MGQDTRHEEAVIDSVLDGRYTLRREIARGGQGAVFEAEHLITRARVAIKTLMLPALDRAAAHARLIREARILGALRHPSIVAVHDAGICPKYGPFLVLEMIEGRPLDGILVTRQKLSVGQSTCLAVDLCGALSDVHRHGMVHRDVKPSNILIARTPNGERVQLIDFGIAKVGAEEESGTAKITQSGELLGTVEYMAPEQIMGSAVVDASADVYAVGVVIYECLTGEVPYSGALTTVIANMLARTPVAPIRARRDDVPLALEAAVKKALEIDPGKRFASTAELADACATAFGGVVPALDLLDVRDDREKAASAGPALQAKHAAAPLAPPSANHRRQYVRAPYVTPVRVVMAKGSTDGRTEDLSEGGLLMITEGAITDGDRVTLRLPLPLSGRVAELVANTKWVKTRRNQRAIGAEFIDASEEVRAEIRNYVALMTGAKVAPPRVGT